MHALFGNQTKGLLHTKNVFNSLCGVRLFCFYFLNEQKEGFRGKGNKTTQLTLSSLPSVLLKAHKSIGITYTEPKTTKNSL